MRNGANETQRSSSIAVLAAIRKDAEGRGTWTRSRPQLV